MRELSKISIITAILSVFVLVSQSPAYAGRIAIDPVPMTGFTPCSVGSSCVPVEMSFGINYGKGLTKDLYIYNNGLVTLGSELSTSFIAAPSLASIGTDVFTPAYSPASTTSSFTIGAGTTSDFETFPFVPFFRVNYVSTYSGESTFVQFSIYQLGNTGDFALQYGYSDPNNLFAAPSGVLDPAALIGYKLGLNSFATTAGVSTALIASDTDDFDYVFRGAGNPVSTVPLPSSLPLFGAAICGIVYIGWRRNRMRAA